MRTGLAAAASVLALLAIAQNASANSIAVSIDPASPRVDDIVNLTVTGTVFDDGDVAVYQEENGADCAPNEGDHRSRVNTSLINYRFPPPGSFTFKPQTTFTRAATYRLCAYLYYLLDDEDARAPRALATTLVTVQPPPPPPDRDGDGVPDASDTCPDVAAAGSFTGCPVDIDRDTVADNVDRCPNAAGPAPSGCPTPSAPQLSGSTAVRLGTGTLKVGVRCVEACTIRARGTIGGRSFRTATGSAAAGGVTTMSLKLSSANLRALRKSLRSKKSLKARLTVTITTPGGSASTVRTVTVRR